MEFIRLRTQVYKLNFDLFQGILEGIIRNKQTIQAGDVLVINSKIVAVSQGRVVKLSEISPAKKTTTRSQYGKGKEDPRFVALVEREADQVVPGHMLLTITDGIFTPAAGIDRSNTPDGTAVLWPKDPWATAWTLYKKLVAHYKQKKLGVIITDSTCTPLRAGTTGVALAWAGFKGVEDVRGKKDIYGKRLAVTRRAVADNLASGAQVLMGEAAEKVPLVIVRAAPLIFTTTKPKPGDGSISLSECLYSGLYGALNARD